MYQAKLCFFAIACMAGLVGFSPVVTLAAETDTESVTLSEKDRDQKDNKSAYKKKMKEANQKWDTLSSKQKEEVYALIENKMKAEINIMDKLVDYGVMTKEDADAIKNHMTAKFKKIKDNGEFPLMRMKDREKRN
ncbi:MAG: hypothetical protein K0S76_232 [Herbinix sp.]|jgi:hypothetical protein|nr:hypothetical protein [Herbinix sp.]